MLWTFTRGSARVNIEVRRAPESGSYELVVDYPDGREVVERFRNPRRLVNRMLNVQERLARNGWLPMGRGVPSPAPVRSLPARNPAMALTTALLAAQRRWARRLAACFGF